MMKFISALVLALLLAASNSVGASPEKADVQEWTEEDIMTILDHEDLPIPDEIIDKISDYEINVSRRDRFTFYLR